jgi:bifunctional DNA-binding transcriptional regulator/antitoxin component of YhaV-PrlF toxin-antitoxin module
MGKTQYSEHQRPDHHPRIPAEIREQMKLAVGTKLSIQRDGQTLILQPITPEFIDSLCGATKGLGKLRDAMHRDDEER